MRRFVVLPLACFASSILYAQTGTDIYAIGFKISSIEKSGNALRVSIDYGLDAGVKLTQEVRPYGIPRENPQGHTVRLGTAKLIEVTQQKAFADITLYDDQIVLAGDLLYVYMTL